MPLYCDIARYAYPSYWNLQAVCRLRIWQRGRATVAMMTELPENPGTSVTNQAEVLATQVCREFELWPSLTRWIEHYPPGDSFGESFDEVTFTLDPHAGLTRPRWRRLTRAEVARLIGEPVSPPGNEVPDAAGPREQSGPAR